MALMYGWDVGQLLVARFVFENSIVVVSGAAQFVFIGRNQMDEQLFYSGIDMYLCTAKPFLPFDANPSLRFVGLIGWGSPILLPVPSVRHHPMFFPTTVVPLTPVEYFYL